MAKTTLKDLSSSSSSDEDELETPHAEEFEELSSSEDDEPKDPVISSSAAVTTGVPESESETETDSEEEEEEEEAVASPVKRRKKEAALALHAEKSGTKKKRKNGEGSSKDTNVKRAKKLTWGEEEEEEKNRKGDTKKPAFHRIWSEEDEISLLQGIIDFKADTGKSLNEDKDGLYEFTKKSISFEVSKSQFMDKIRTMKKKYFGKEKTSFTKAHDQKCYKLSKIIWETEGTFESVAKSNAGTRKSPRKKIKQELNFVGLKDEEEDEKKVLVNGSCTVKKLDWFEDSFIGRSIAGHYVDEYHMTQAWSLVTMEKKKNLEDKLKAFQAKQLQEKIDLLNEAVLLIFEASRKET